MLGAGVESLGGSWSAGSGSGLGLQAGFGVLGPGAESTGRVRLLDLECRVLVRDHKQDLEC